MNKTKKVIEEIKKEIIAFTYSMVAMMLVTGAMAWVAFYFYGLILSVETIAILGLMSYYYFSLTINFTRR